MSSTRSNSKRSFLVRTYLHLAGALAAFALFESWMLTSGFGDQVYDRLISVPWILILAAFMVVGWLARSTGADFSFLKGLLRWGGILALIAIFGALSFGWHLGTWFNVGMIGLAGAAILEDTSWILRRYRGGREVAAALSLFASVAMMFFYLLRQMGRLGRG